MVGNAQSKFVNEEDVNEYKEEYNPYWHCAHWEYRPKLPNELKEHMEKEHTQYEKAPLAESESLIEEEELMDAIDVWKIYQLLHRMNNK